MSKDNVTAVATLEMIKQARILSEGSDNEEYIRGQAELIAQFVAVEDAEEFHEAIATITEMIGK